MNKALVLLSCACAIAHAQFGNTRTQSAFAQSTITNPRFQGTAQQTANQYQTSANQYQKSANRFQDSANQYQNTANQYQQSADQFQQTADRQRVSNCRELNERSAIPGSCDKYVECINGTSEEKQCPDGLRYDPNVNFDVYPCKYPNEVACLERSALQPAQPTDECPHQFGFFKLGDAKNCSGFRNCVNGRGFDFVCPDGLAFSSETYRCEWPDQVADCDAEAFLGFRCPDVPISKELGPPAGYRFYRSNADCQQYFLCIDGKPRALSCGGYSAFDELISGCVSADEVPSCPAELQNRAKVTREEEQQRLARELAVSTIPAAQRRRL